MEKTTKEEKSWILYDVANSAFVLIMITSIMPLFFKNVISKGIPNEIATANWGFANSIAALAIALLAPFLGVAADSGHRKKGFFSFFLFWGIVLTLLLITIRPGSWLFCLVLFAAARIGWSGANIFYDSFLVDVSPKSRMDRISALGYAWGYAGSIIPFLMTLFLIQRFSGGDDPALLNETAVKGGFVIVAVWWGLFSIPILKNVRQKHTGARSPGSLKKTVTKIFTTFRRIRQYRNIFLFLLAHFFYIDGVETTITMAVAFGMDIGLGSTSLILAILMVQILSFPFAWLFGNLAGRYSTKSMLLAGIGIYILITIIAFFIPQFTGIRTKTVIYWTLTFLVSTAMGGIQALSRSYFARLIPPENATEFFGFYNIAGRFATITGPFLMAMVIRITGKTHYGVLGILLLFIAGGWLLLKVKE